jgi:hypothetical protein
MRPKLALLAVSLAASLAGQGSLRVEIIEGGGAIHNVAATLPLAPRVRVTDLAGRPIPFAAVTFNLPASGPGGTSAGQRRISVATGDNGEAVLPDLRLNPDVGTWTIRVDASYRGRAGSAVIAQISAAPVEAYLAKTPATVARR